MSSSAAFVPPAHGDLVPNAMNFTIDATERLRQALHLKLPELDIRQAFKAQSQIEMGLCGYYKIQTRTGALLFAKIKPANRAKLEKPAAELSTALFREGARTLPLYASPVQLPDGAQVFLYPWVQGAFFDESAAQLQSLGKELALLHNALNATSPVEAGTKTIFSLWQEQLERVRHASFAPEAATTLRMAESIFNQYPSGLAHNDLHRANVLFSPQGDLAAFVDFEDAIGIHSSRLVDLAAIIERFCLWPTPRPEGVILFLENYARFSDGTIDFKPAELVRIGLCRCFYSLAILYAAPAPEHPGWGAEVTKFEMLLQCWKHWEALLQKAIPKALTR